MSATIFQNYTVESITNLVIFPISVIRQLEDDVSNVSHQMSELQSVNENLSESKVRLELRAVDLEEQRDRTIEEAKELEVTIKNLKTELQVRNFNRHWLFPFTVGI